MTRKIIFLAGLVGIGAIDLIFPGVGPGAVMLASVLVFVVLDGLAGNYTAETQSLIVTVLVAAGVFVLIAAMLWWPVVWVGRLFVANTEIPQGHAVVIFVVCGVLLAGGISSVAAWWATRAWCSVTRIVATRMGAAIALAGAIYTEAYLGMSPSGVLGGAVVLGYLVGKAYMWICRTVLPVLVVLLAGCAVNVSDAPSGIAEWRSGWADGCNYARSLNGWGTPWQIDVTRQQSDPDYGQGIKAGIAECE